MGARGGEIRVRLRRQRRRRIPRLRPGAPPAQQQERRPPSGRPRPRGRARQRARPAGQPGARSARRAAPQRASGPWPTSTFVSGCPGTLGRSRPCPAACLWHTLESWTPGPVGRKGQRWRGLGARDAAGEGQHVPSARARRPASAARRRNRGGDVGADAAPSGWCAGAGWARGQQGARADVCEGLPRRR